MYQKDQVKLVIALVLFATIGISYYLDGKSILTKSIVAIAIVIWLATMAYFRKNDGQAKD